ncbi:MULTISPECIES: aldose 1-epimerase, partial [unclassified Pseudomonas]|uniref:aldose 1-epimerase n=1 Tax=unclassified Pseudomonas TaxID=196821 RepID=UPI0021C87057
MAEPELLVLEDRLTRLLLAPGLGGSLVDWRRRADSQPLLRPGNLQARPLTARQQASFPLVPWSNRIAGGGFEAPDGWFELPPNTPDSPLAVHGSAWQQPWEILAHSADTVLLRLESATPFAYRAEQRIHLADGCLTLELKVTHLDPRPLWHGLGLHPFFPRTAATQVQARAAGVWLCDGQQLSTEHRAVPEEWNLENAAELPAGKVDHCFTGWDGRCRILQADADYWLDCQAEGFDHYLLYCPPGQTFFCFEPVSHPVNAHHLPGRPGLVLLQAGQSVSGRWRMAYRSAPLREQARSYRTSYTV